MKPGYYGIYVPRSLLTTLDEAAIVHVFFCACALAWSMMDFLDWCSCSGSARYRARLGVEGWK